MKKMMILLASFITVASAPAMAASISLWGADYVPLLDQPARSCAAQITNYNDKENYDIAGIVALMGNVGMRWEGSSSPLFLEKMTVTFQGSEIVSGRQDIVIAGEELGFLWAGDSVVPKFAPYSGSNVTPFCRFRIGSVNVVDKYKYFEGVGVITMEGRYQVGSEWKTATGKLLFRYHMSPMPRPKNP